MTDDPFPGTFEGLNPRETVQPQHLEETLSINKGGGQVRSSPVAFVRQQKASQDFRIPLSRLTVNASASGSAAGAS